MEIRFINPKNDLVSTDPTKDSLNWVKRLLRACLNFKGQLLSQLSCRPLQADTALEKLAPQGG